MYLARNAVAAVVVSGLLAGPAAADIIIDDFSSIGDPNQWPVVVNTINTVDILESGLGNVIGGTRHSSIRATYLDIPGLDFVQAAIVPNFGMILDYSSTSGARGDWNLLYDNGGEGLNADFSGLTDIILDFGRFDFANGQPLPIVVTLFDQQGSAQLNKSLTTPGPQSINFALNDFIGINSIDLANVTAVSVFLDPGIAVDFRLGRVYGVPTPASMMLLAAGSLAFVGGRRSRQHA